jgi:type I restriction enzyme, S subunit
VNSSAPLVTLSEVLTPVSRPESVDPEKIYKILGAHWYAEGLYVKDTLPGSQIRADKVFRVEEGDFVYNRLFAWKGSFAVATEGNAGCYVSNEFPCFAINQDRADAKFLWWYFSRASAWDEALGLSTGGTPTSRNRLKEEKFLAMKIPLPPLPKQRRIVARIEALASKINEAHRARWEVAQKAEALAGAVASRLFAKFPDRYTVEAVAEVRGRIQKGPHRVPGANPVRYLTVAHVQRNHVSTSDPRHFEVTPEELERWRLFPGDVLIIEGNGSAEQIGRTALFQGEINDCVHQNHVIRIRPDCKRIVPEFLNLFLNSPAGQDAVQAQSRTTSGLRTLSVGRIKNIRVPVPSIPEQRRIVAESDALQAQVDALKKLQAETAAELDVLLPSVLDKAFKGEF